MTDTLPTGLYVHYPWCIRKCPYCDFNSVKKIPDSDADEIYLSSLIRDFDSSVGKISHRCFNTVYFGGGTPSLFPPRLMGKFLEHVSSYLEKNCEISMEANPGTVSYELLKEYRQAGINRISLGVQSFSDDCLMSLGRIHSSAQAADACKNVVKAGFDNFNIDLMHGLPGQDLKMALSDLQMAVSLGCNHLSWYELTLEEGTYFGRHPPELPNEDALADIENGGFSYLKEQGFERYEVSAFTKDRRCQNNLNYWYFYDYLGIGAGAHSKIRTKMHTCRRANDEDVRSYIRQTESETNDFVRVADTDLPFEFMLNRLRVFDEIGFDEFYKTTGLDYELIRPMIEKACHKGLMQLSESGYSLSAQGRWMLNEILEYFL
ncbi:MAG: radical SAM family heme chaperone HemW [Succinivibrio sp.]